MKLIYPEKFKIPNNLHIKIEDYNFHGPAIEVSADLLKACRFTGKVTITHGLSTIHTYHFNYVYGWVKRKDYENKI